ncbi:hypothetical protein DD630_17165 [Streptomyces sp. BSE7F]|nr:hypothetical protein DD630_17165 [Streptomyces sp. BSE7F]
MIQRVALRQLLRLVAGGAQEVAHDQLGEPVAQFSVCGCRKHPCRGVGSRLWFGAGERLLGHGLRVGRSTDIVDAVLAVEALTWPEVGCSEPLDGRTTA